MSVFRGKPRNPAPVKPTKDEVNNKPLSNVVLETKQVHELVEQCRDDLADVNARMRDDLNDPPHVAKTADTLEKSMAVQAKVDKVSNKVATITDELVEHVRDRRLLDFQFAAAVEQGAAARHAANAHKQRPFFRVRATGFVDNLYKTRC